MYLCSMKPFLLSDYTHKLQNEDDGTKKSQQSKWCWFLSGDLSDASFFWIGDEYLKSVPNQS